MHYTYSHLYIHAFMYIYIYPCAHAHAHTCICTCTHAAAGTQYFRSPFMEAVDMVLTSPCWLSCFWQRFLMSL